jgi:hypothetical protein
MTIKFKIQSYIHVKGIEIKSHTKKAHKKCISEYKIDVFHKEL